jgi:predicted membrane protein
MFVDKYNFSTSTGVTEVFLSYLQAWKTSVTLVNVLGLYTNLQTWKTSVTPVDVLKLYLSTNMEDPSDTSMCTGVIY